MATKRKASSSSRRSTTPSYETLRTGPWKSVVTTIDPGDDDPATLQDLVNGYIPDPRSGSGLYARPGAICQNHGFPLGLSGVRHGQDATFHIDLDGSVFNLAVCDGQLYRADSFADLVNVTPVGATINPTNRVFFTSLNGQLILSDGEHRPWIVTNLSAPHVTLTPIVVDGTNSTWSAYGRPFIWQGALFFIVNQIGGVSARATLVWSEPGDPSTGYRQTNFSNFATLEQTQQGPAPIYVGLPTEIAIYLFREGSITTMQGTLANLQSQATTDTIAVNVGALSAAGARIFGDAIFFADQLGRPWMFRLGNTPQDIWKQMRAVVDASSIGYPEVTAVLTTAAIESTLNLYLLANWSPIPTASAAPNKVFVFDAHTGSYQGRWRFGGTKITPPSTDAVWGPDVWGASVWGSSVWGGSSNTPSLLVTGSGTAGTVWGDSVWGAGVWGSAVWAGGSGPGPTPDVTTDGISIDVLGNWQDPQGRSVLVILGSELPGGEGGFVWTLQSVTGIPDHLVTVSGLQLVTLSGDDLTTVGQAAQWMDGSPTNLITPLFQPTTNRLGYQDDIVWNVDQVIVVTSTDSPVTVSVGTASVEVTVEGTPTPVASVDNTFRLLAGMDGIQGRGPVVTVAPTDASAQRIVQSISIRAVPSLAGIDDP